jgi:cell division protease FtsH
MAYITPEFDEIARTSICPYGMITGYTLFVEDEERSAGAILTRSDMEAHMVVNLAGRCSEKLVMGESEVTGGVVLLDGAAGGCLYAVWDAC